MRRFLIGLAAIAMTVGHALASDSIESETSHAVGGAVVAGVATYLADGYWPQDRGWIGFTVSTAVGVAGEGLDAANGMKFSILDAASTALGAAVGAFVTDRYFLMPAVAPDSEQGAYLGVTGKVRF